MCVCVCVYICIYKRANPNVPSTYWQVEHDFHQAMGAIATLDSAIDQRRNLLGTQLEGQRLRSFGLWAGTALARREFLFRRRHLMQLQADSAALATLARDLGRGAFRAAVVSGREAVRVLGSYITYTCVCVSMCVYIYPTAQRLLR